MESLVGYGSDDDNEIERFGDNHSAGASGADAHRRRDDDTNYDDVNMDMSEDSGAESEPELPPAEPASTSRHSTRDDRRGSADSRERDRDRDRDRDRESDRRDKRRESPARARLDRRSPRRDDRHRSERRDRSRSSHDISSRRGLLGDKPEDRSSDSKQVPALMDLKPFGGDAPPAYNKSQDARDAVSPRFVNRDRRDRDRERERDREGRERERHSRRSEEKRSHKHPESRSRSRGAVFPPTGAHPSGSTDRRVSPPSGDYRPSSYKVNKKLEVMEKMGLQIKTPDGSMATAQQLRAAAHDAPPHAALPSYCNPCGMNVTKIMDQVQKRKLLWSNKNKTEAEEAAKWSGTKFAQDNDGKQVSKFMRLMGIKQPEALQSEPAESGVDPNKKQEELFQAMQAQYEVARATTHTMRGVGLGFQRSQF